MSMNHVPREILDEIVQKIDNKVTLYNLSQADKKFNRITRKYLLKYRQEYIDGGLKDILNHLDTKAIIGSLKDILNHLDTKAGVDLKNFSSINFSFSNLLWLNKYPEVQETLNYASNSFYYPQPYDMDYNMREMLHPINFNNNTYSVVYQKMYCNKIVDIIGSDYYEHYATNRNNFVRIESRDKPLPEELIRFTQLNYIRVIMPREINNIPFLKVTLSGRKIYNQQVPSYLYSLALINIHTNKNIKHSFPITKYRNILIRLIEILLESSSNYQLI